MNFRQQRRWRRSFTYIDYLQFPFIINKKTVSYLNKNRTIFVLNAFHYVGRSYVSHSIRLIYGNKIKIFCEDSHSVENEGLRRHDSFEKALEERIRHIVVHHDTLDASSVLFYREKAQHYNYFIIFVQPKIPYREDIISLQLKNQVDPCNELFEMNTISPEYYAFFLNEATSKILMQKAKIYFNKCFEYFPDFKKRYMGKAGSESFDCIYNMDYHNLLHCTTYHMLDHSHPPYHHNPSVKQSIGKQFVIHVQGFFFTTRTAGAIIKLKKTTLKLFNKNDYFSYKTDTNGNIYPTFAITSDDSKSEGAKKVGIECNEELKSDGDKYIQPEPLQKQAVISLRKGSRAHLTLGCQDGVSAVQTGFDLMHLKHKALEKNGGVESGFGKINDVKCGGGDECVIEKSMDEVVIEEGCFLRCHEGMDCEVRLDWSVPVHCIFNASY